MGLERTSLKPSFDQERNLHDRFNTNWYL